jgi:hypothetical protein
MQKRASLGWRIAAAFIALAVACSPLAMQTESAEMIGVASEQDGEVLGGASTQGLAGNGTQSRCPEDSACRMGR